MDRGFGMPARPARQRWTVVLSDRSDAAGRRFVHDKHDRAADDDAQRTVSGRALIGARYDHMLWASRRMSGRYADLCSWRHHAGLLPPGSSAGAGERRLLLRRVDVRHQRPQGHCHPNQGSTSCTDMPTRLGRRSASPLCLSRTGKVSFAFRNFGYDRPVRSDADTGIEREHQHES
jgi:hypothetical protein